MPSYETGSGGARKEGGSGGATHRHQGSQPQAKEGDIMSKYVILSKKGEGTFSEVLESRSRETDEAVAIKKMKARYDSLQQANKIREVQAMRKLANHPNILKLKEIIYDPRSSTLYLILELMDMNMYELIRGKRHYLPESKIRFFMLQLVEAIRFMHKCGIFHRDVKPENILVKGDLLKLADFGSCRARESKQPFTEYISTRWYRAPECLLTDGYYDYKMDVWSVGCVFYEISKLTPLFPGQNEIDQIDKIHKLLGTPSSEILSKFKRSRSMSFNFPPRSRDDKTLNHLTESMPSDGVELMYRMLEYDPHKRIQMEDALSHPYLRTLSDQLKRQKEAKRAAAMAAATPPAGDTAEHRHAHHQHTHHGDTSPEHNPTDKSSYYYRLRRKKQKRPTKDMLLQQNTHHGLPKVVSSNTTSSLGGGSGAATSSSLMSQSIMFGGGGGAGGPHPGAASTFRLPHIFQPQFKMPAYHQHQAKETSRKKPQFLPKIGGI